MNYSIQNCNLILCWSIIKSNKMDILKKMKKPRVVVLGIKEY